ncbi:MAG: hypothetical protein ACLR1T_03575 [Evtepia gabavorous]
MSQTRVEGTIRKALSGFYYVQTEQTLVTCRARGKFRYQKATPWWGTGWPLPSSRMRVGLLVEILPAAMPFSVRRWPIWTSWSSSPPGRSR